MPHSHALAPVLQAAGYDTQVFEFVGGEHTAKNVMIAAVRRGPYHAPGAASVARGKAPAPVGAGVKGKVKNFCLHVHTFILTITHPKLSP